MSNKSSDSDSENEDEEDEHGNNEGGPTGQEENDGEEKDEKAYDVVDEFRKREVQESSCSGWKTT